MTENLPEAQAIPDVMFLFESIKSSKFCLSPEKWQEIFKVSVSFTL